MKGKTKIREVRITPQEVNLVSSTIEKTLNDLMVERNLPLDVVMMAYLISAGSMLKNAGVIVKLNDSVASQLPPFAEGYAAADKYSPENDPSLN